MQILSPNQGKAGGKEFFLGVTTPGHPLWGSILGKKKGKMEKTGRTHKALGVPHRGGGSPWVQLKNRCPQYKVPDLQLEAGSWAPGLRPAVNVVADSQMTCSAPANISVEQTRMPTGESRLVPAGYMAAGRAAAGQRGWRTGTRAYTDRICCTHEKCMA